MSAGSSSENLRDPVDTRVELGASSVPRERLLSAAKQEPVRAETREAFRQSTVQPQDYHGAIQSLQGSELRLRLALQTGRIGCGSGTPPT